MQNKTLHTASFDQQAAAYEKRAGLNKFVCQSIAASINDICQLTPGDTLLELGCGTGQPGGLLDKLPGTYLGFDLSSGMLNQFSKNYPDIQGVLVQADGRNKWPVENRQVKVIFASRSLHWLSVEHVVSEAHRVTTNSAYLLVGRIERSPNCWESKLRKQLHLLLRENSLIPLDGQTHLEDLRHTFAKNNAEVMEAVTIRTWTSNKDVLRAIKNWETKDGLSGTQASSKLKKLILLQLRQWAEEHFGLPLPSGVEQSYIIYGFKLGDE